MPQSGTRPFTQKLRSSPLPHSKHFMWPKYPTQIPPPNAFLLYIVTKKQHLDIFSSKQYKKPGNGLAQDAFRLWIVTKNNIVMFFDQKTAKKYSKTIKRCYTNQKRTPRFHHLETTKKHQNVTIQTKNHNLGKRDLSVSHPKRPLFVYIVTFSEFWMKNFVKKT